MSAKDLNELVEKIVQRVMQRIEEDPELAAVLGQKESSEAAKQKDKASAAVMSTKKLYTERDILELAQKKCAEIKVPGTTIFTPSARDAAKAKGITIIRE